MSVSGASRSRTNSDSSDSSIIVSTASSTSDDSDDQNAYSAQRSSTVTQMTTDKTASSGTALTRTISAPVMATREHVLQDCPSDVRRYFLLTHIADQQATPEEQAVNLRRYAEISKAHHAEVIEMFNESPELSMAATRHALPLMATFGKKTKERKNQFDLASQELFRTYHHVYVDVSTSTLHDDAQAIRFPKGARQIAISNLMKSDHIKEFIIDVSHDPYYLRPYEIPRHIDLWTGELKNYNVKLFGREKEVIAQQKFELKERQKLSETLCEALKNFAKRKEDPTISFGLRCVNQAFKTFMMPVVQVLADYKMGLGSMKILDLGYTFIPFERKYGRGGLYSESDHKLLTTYADNLTEFLGSSRSLQYLGLRRSGLIPACLLQVVTALKENFALVNFDLSKNYLSGDWVTNKDVIQTLINSLEGKKSLRFVNLAGCGLDDGTADLLLEFLKKNPQVTMCIAENSGISLNHAIYKLDNAEAENSEVDYSSS